MNRRMLITAAAALALSATTVLAQSGGKPMKITLNFLAAAPNAGFMMAKQMGLYEKAGINLTIEEGKGSGTTAQMVATGQTDIGFADAPAAMQLRTKGAPVKIIAPVLQTNGFADAPAAMQLRTKGAPVKIVAPVLQTNGFAIISLEETGIATPKDLIGKKLAVQPGTAQTTLLDAILASNGIDKGKVDVINIDPGAFVGALLEKKVDAILGGADFHSVQIRERGFKVRDIFYRDVGVPTVGLSIIARDDRIKADADLYKKFVEVSLQGWDAARKNPDAAADAVVAQFPSVKKAQVLAQFDVVNKLLCAPGAASLGKVPEKNWNTSFDLLTQYLGLPKDKPITDYYTTDLVPASAPACS